LQELKTNDKNRIYFEMKKKTVVFLKRNKWLKTVPNTLTVCNSLCGFAAILNTLQAYKETKDPAMVFVVSSCMIIGAMVFDALDGFTARIFNAASLKGIQMDSLADMVTFGVAPAVLVAVMAHLYSATRVGYYMAWLLCAIYLAAAAHRLAQYNVMTMVEKKSSQKFHGLPTPGGAAAICSLVFLFGFYDPGHNLVKLLPWYAGVLGILLVSKIRYQHMGKWLGTLRKHKKRKAVLVIFIFCFILYPAVAVAVVINGYVLWGLASFIFNPDRAKRNPATN
jgi:CDP-diacylglycerol---serine O-phosphatidyltransferase